MRKTWQNKYLIFQRQTINFNFTQLSNSGEFDDDDFVILKTALCNQIDDFMDRRARTLVKKKR